MLPDKVIAIYCFCDDLLKAIGHKTKEGSRTSVAEILTTALISALVFKGNQSAGLDYMRSHRMALRLPGKSGFTKRLHALSELLFQLVGHLIKRLHCSHRYLLDSFPLSVCRLARMRRCRLQQGREFFGFCVAHRQYFYGVRVQLITTGEDVPVEVCFVAGAEHDAKPLGLLWDFEAGEQVYGDNAYHCYAFEDLAGEAGIEVLTVRKPNYTPNNLP